MLSLSMWRASKVGLHRRRFAAGLHRIFFPSSSRPPRRRPPPRRPPVLLASFLLPASSPHGCVELHLAPTSPHLASCSTSSTWWLKKLQFFGASGGGSARSCGGVVDPVAGKLDPVARTRRFLVVLLDARGVGVMQSPPPRRAGTAAVLSLFMATAGVAAGGATDLCSASATATVGSLKFFLLLPDELLLPHPATSRLLLNKEQRVCVGYCCCWCSCCYCCCSCCCCWWCSWLLLLFLEYCCCYYRSFGLKVKGYIKTI
ncbi:uncharacterized protein LOC119323627 isoform X2 [Triticum dicoccoides]|nr:uncharacterized protein LOC119323627 isoform X2 [Triticum dicoccoides]XP_037453221.1 uncharacterized protein LOC119323627 isoform X2 [Triticum dicoccoides]XP_037453222.1 uncharacterized protein LOC119323627 isoform X2 [Triticum dicoccoides]